MRPPASPDPPPLDLVRWAAWNDTTLEQARSSDRPILLRIAGHSPWACTAGLRAPAVQRLMQERFVPVCVDAEERPDLAHVARTIGELTDGAGLPLLFVLTPAGRLVQALFGDQIGDDPYGRRLHALLAAFEHALRERPQEAAARADGIAMLVELMLRVASPSRSIDPTLLAESTAILRERLDRGLPAPALEFLVARGHADAVRAALASPAGQRGLRTCGDAHQASLFVRVWVACGDPAFRVLALAAARRAWERLGRRRVPTSARGHTLAALADVGRQTDDRELLARACDVAGQLLTRLTHDGRLPRVDDAGSGQLEDYAAVAHGLMAMHRATHEPRWLESTRRVAATAVELFADPLQGGFFRTAADDLGIVGRFKDLQDRPAPSGNSLLASVLLQLSAGDPAATAALALVADEARAAPEAFGRALLEMHAHWNRLRIT